MRLYRVKRDELVSWCEDIECIVLAVDIMWAEKLARMSSDNFRKAKLTITEIDTDKEGVLLKTNTGA